MLQCAVISNLGNRAVNEDSCRVFDKGEDNRLLLVADGLGGHGRGDEASRTAMRVAADIITETSLTGIDMIKGIFERSQRCLLARQIQEQCPGSMRTTLCMALAEKDKLIVAHIGDSRVYVFRDGKELLRTKDHSVPQMLVASGEIKEKDIRHHPDRNRLLRVLGTAETTELRYEIEKPLDLQRGDAVLLCSDGFWEYITEREMRRTLKKSKGEVQEWLSMMNDIVQKRGKNQDMDNNTAIAAIAK